MVSLLLLLSLAALTPAGSRTLPARETHESLEPALVVSRGPGLAPIPIPAREELEFSVAIDLGRLGLMRLGSVSLRAEHGFEAGPLPAPGAQEARRRYARIESRASGSYVGYQLDHRLVTRHLPDQAWPRTLFTDTQSGSENRRRELWFGERETETGVRYRSDHHCGGCERLEHHVESHFFWRPDSHCDRCRRGEHRTWKEPVSRSVPEGTLDILSALYLARSLVAPGVEDLHFPMLDKLELWDVHLRKGDIVSKRTAAGEFTCLEVRLESSLPADEEREEKPEFAGLFGIRGELRIFVEHETGVPVWIEGTVPAGPIQVEVVVRLESCSGVSWGDSQKEIR